MQGDVATFQFQVVPYGLKCIPSMAGYALHYIAEKNIPNVSEDAVKRVKRHHVSHIAAKTSILSSREVARGSIPRKELIALDICTRLLKKCLKSRSLSIERYEMWTHLQTVIKWCSSMTLELRIFERNRVDLILKRTNRNVPRFVPTDQNPANVATRGCPLNNKEK